MSYLGNGLVAGEYIEDALSVQEAELAMGRRLGASEISILYTQGNLATTYARLGRYERALQIEGDVYQGYLRHLGEEHGDTLITVNNYVNSLIINNRSEEAQVLMRKMIPVARRTLGEGHETTLQMRWNYALALYRDAGATVDNLREAVTTLEDTEQIARRVLGGAHPLTGRIEFRLREAREELAARETPSPSA